LSSPRVAGTATQQFRTVLRVFAPLWLVGDGFSSTLIVRNTYTQSAVTSTPIIFTPDRSQLRLPAIQLAPNSVKKLSLEEALQSAGSTAKSGALALEMDLSQSPTIIGEMVITNYQKGLIFDLPIHSGYAGDEARALHASWWLPDENTQAVVVLFNAAEQSIRVHPAVTANFVQYTATGITLAAHEVRKVDLRDLIPRAVWREVDQGSITLSYEGPAHALLPALLISNEKNGFSLTAKFFAKRSQQNQTDTVNWHFPTVLAGVANPALGFNRGSKFTPYALLSNVTSNVIAPQLKVNFAADAQSTSSRTLPLIPLAPLETRLIDLSDVTQDVAAKTAGSCSLQLSHLGAVGDLALHIFSVDQRKNLVFTAEGTTKASARLDSVYWNVAGDLEAMLVVENTGSSAVQAQATLMYANGDGSHASYKLPALELPAQATRIVNLKQIINAGRPDEAGRVIAPGTTLGTVTIEATGGQNRDVLAGGSVTFDPDSGQYGVFFLPMCSPSGPGFAMPGFPFGITIYLDGIELPPCEFFLPIIIITICEFLCNPDPGIPPHIDSISPDRALVGSPVDVAIHRSFFGNAPTLIVDQGISAQITSASSTLINARFNISLDNVGGNHAVFVQSSNGLMSNGANFFVQLPSSLTVLLAAPALPLPNGCPQDPPPEIGTQLRIRYQINDQSGSPLVTSMSGVREDMINLTILGQRNPNFDALDKSVIPGATESDGTFVDVPIGVCGDPLQL